MECLNPLGDVIVSKDHFSRWTPGWPQDDHHKDRATIKSLELSALPALFWEGKGLELGYL